MYWFIRQENMPPPSAILAYKGEPPEEGKCWGPGCEREAITEFFCSFLCQSNWHDWKNRQGGTVPPKPSGGLIESLNHTHSTICTKWSDRMRENDEGQGAEDA